MFTAWRSCLAPTSIATCRQTSGWLAGLQIGYERHPFISFLPFTRVEAFVFGGKTDGSVSDTAPPLADISMKSVDGQVNVIDGTQAAGQVQRRTIEFGYRSEFDDRIDAQTTITWGYVSFIRNSEENSSAVCINICGVRRFSNVDTWMFGSMLMMEPEFRISPAIALVGRAGCRLLSLGRRRELPLDPRTRRLRLHSTLRCGIRMTASVSAGRWERL